MKCGDFERQTEADGLLIAVLRHNRDLKKDSPLMGDCPFLKYVDNNDTVSYGCIRVALELQPSEENATLIKRVRQIGIYLINPPKPLYFQGKSAF